MKLIINKFGKSLLTVLIFIILLLSLRSDYRFVNDINCCGDDHSYYVHSLTIVDDFDFNYDNQLEYVEGKVYEYNDKIAPRNYVGSGILASPFMFIGKYMDIFLERANIDNSEIMPYKLFLYSLSPVFYIFFSILLFSKLIDKSANKFNKYLLVLMIFGNGVHYYAFERYSMTHSYEFFMVTLLIYLHYIFYTSMNINRRNLLAFILPFIYLITLLVRYTNYFIFLVPFWITKISLLNESKNRLHKNPYFLIGTFTSFISYYLISLSIYGQFIIRPQIAYGQDFSLISWANDSFNMNNLISKHLVNLFKIFYTQEFGIIWFIPVLAFIIIYLLRDTFVNTKNFITNTLILISIGMPFAIVLLWETVASSFGIRYLFAVVPIAIYVLINIKNLNKNIWAIRYLTVFSIFSFLGVLFFETSSLASLSEIDQLSSFGKVTRFAQPLYLTGVIKSIFLFDSYQIIFATSFFGAIVMKIFISIFGVDGFLNILSNLGLDISNGDVLNIIKKVELIDSHKFLFVSLLLLFNSRKLVNTIYIENKGSF
mgnify:FL=1